MNLSSIQQQSRKEYFLRINRVVDYIDAHLDEEAKPEGEFGKMHLHCGYLRSGETTVAHIKISKPICLKVPPKGTFPNFQTI